MSSDRPPQELLDEILADFKERGLEEVTIHHMGSHIHVSAINAKRKRVVNAFARTEYKKRWGMN